MVTAGGGGQGLAGSGRAGSVRCMSTSRGPAARAKAGDRPGGPGDRRLPESVVKSLLHSLLGPAYGPETAP